MKSFIRYLREENDLGQAALASIVGVSQGHISDLERGRREMTSSFVTKAAPVLGVDAVTLLSAHEFEKIARKAEEGDPAAPHEALALAKRLLELVEEPGALDEEQAAQIQEIVGRLIRVMEGKPVDAPRGVLDKPLVPAAAKASPDALATLRGLGARRDEVLDEGLVYERLVDDGLSAQALEQLLDQISERKSRSRLPALERRNLKAIQAAIERRIADLGDDGDRPSEQVLASDRAAATKAAASEAQEQRDYLESMREIGLDTFGRPHDPRRQEHERALKSSEYDLTEDEIQTGVSRRGLPLIGKELERRRRI